MGSGKGITERELDAINRYEARIDVPENESLKRALQHNSDEEKERAAILAERLRENDPTKDKMF